MSQFINNFNFYLTINSFEVFLNVFKASIVMYLYVFKFDVKRSHGSRDEISQFYNAIESVYNFFGHSIVR